MTTSTKEPIRSKHFTNIGDAIGAMCVLKKYYESTGKKVIFMQQLSVKAQYYPGATHPTVDSENNFVCMNSKMWEMLKPLLLSQEYIHDAEEYTGQPINLDLDVIRGDRYFVNMPNGSLQAWWMYAYPDLATDISKPWITLPNECPENILNQVNGKVILNFTERYRNNTINYFFLQKYQNHLIFSGTPREHLLFCEAWKIDIPLLQAKDFLEVAYAIKFSKFFLGCQSAAWNMAEAMKAPRILEVCRFAQNCLPFYGEKSYGFFHQVGLEYYFDLLY